MTDPGRLFIARIATYVFSKEDPKVGKKGRRKGRKEVMPSFQNISRKGAKTLGRKEMSFRREKSLIVG